MENTCTRDSFLIKLQASVLQLIKKETLAQMFSCEFFEIFKNTLLQNASGGLLLPEILRNMENMQNVKFNAQFKKTLAQCKHLTLQRFDFRYD